MSKNLKFSKFCIVFFFAISMNSCLDDTKNTIHVKEVIEHNNNHSESTSNLDILSKRYRRSIIDQLYEEALKKDAKLNRLNEAILKIPVSKNKNLDQVKKYLNGNEEYWNETEQYISQIQDSVFRIQTIKYFNDLKTAYRNKTRVLEDSQKVIEFRAKALNDKLIALKLFSTQPLMQKYQDKEIPNIKKLENLIKEYDKLIQQTKQIIQFDQKE